MISSFFNETDFYHGYHRALSDIKDWFMSHSDVLSSCRLYGREPLESILDAMRRNGTEFMRYGKDMNIVIKGWNRNSKRYDSKTMSIEAVKPFIGVADRQYIPEQYEKGYEKALYNVHEWLINNRDSLKYYRAYRRKFVEALLSELLSSVKPFDYVIDVDLNIIAGQLREKSKTRKGAANCCVAVLGNHKDR